MFSAKGNLWGSEMRPRPKTSACFKLRLPACAALVLAALVWSSQDGIAAQGDAGKALLETNCGECHGVAPGDKSPLAKAPNLSIVLGSYPGERLEVELSEGIGSRHPTMPQVQFSDEDITSIYYYLHAEEPDGRVPAP